MWFEEIDLDTPSQSCKEVLLVETEEGRTPVRLDFADGGVTVNVYLPDGRWDLLTEVPQERSLRQVVAALTASRPLRAFEVKGQETPAVFDRIKPVRNALKTVLTLWPFPVSLLCMALGMFGRHLANGATRFVIFAVGLFLIMFALSAIDKSQRYRQWALVQGPTNIKVLACEVDLPPMLPEVEVDDVKAEYGALVSDIVYRIEYPALFDPQDVVTREFTLALLRWDNNVGVVGRDELVELAARVRSSFVAAKVHAERVGMEHFPVGKRDGARLALKAARLARDEGASVAEREVALARAVELLDGLALYYVPGGDQARRAITGSGPLQLPGRKNS